MKCVPTWTLAILLGFIFSVAGASNHSHREIPRPLAGHPGNVFLAGENVSVPLPVEWTGGWELRNFEGQSVLRGRSVSSASLGTLPTGYYEILRQGDTNAPIALAVLAPLKEATPIDSPLGVDAAMAWFFTAEQMPAAANFCALAGMNWVRDRVSWEEIEPQANHFLPASRYDRSIEIEANAGLRILQVNHISPPWALADGPRFPADLRDVRHFYREIAHRWQRTVSAFEPWNEADMQVFGAHTGAEIASFQKAAYWGIKEGNPQAIICLTPLYYHNRERLEDIRANRAWLYFDTFNFHYYAPSEAYPEIYRDFRAVSAARPLWITECGRHAPWTGDSLRQDPDLKIQAETVGKIVAASLHEGAQKVFYFCLPHYAEGQDQLGLLRRDLTPRPAYVALAAAGRLLASAKPMGRQSFGNTAIHGFWFNARPDGRNRDVLICWSDTETTVDLPTPPLAKYDSLGREYALSGWPARIGPAPSYLIFPSGTSAKIPLEKPTVLASATAEKPCPIVMQAVWSKTRVLAKRSAYLITERQDKTIPIHIYNFGSKTGHGTLRMLAPQKSILASEVEIDPDDRFDLPVAVPTLDSSSTNDLGVVEIEGDFGALGKTRLSLRLVYGKE